MAEDTQALQLEGETVIAKLASSFPESEQKEVIRDVFLAVQMKSTGTGDNKRKLNTYEAFTYVMACRSLGLNPSLNHLLFLEDQVYISLQGHLHNAHATNALRGMQTRLLSSGDITYTKKGWKWAADTQNKSKQFRYECVIQRVINGEPAEFRAEGVADASNVVWFATDLKLEQMAEARAMRRCLSRAFPVGLSSFEDIQEQKALEIVQESTQAESPQAPMNPLEAKIAEANSIAELEALKPEITKSKSNDMVKSYAARQKELVNKHVEELVVDTVNEPVGPDYLKKAKEKLESGAEAEFEKSQRLNKGKVGWEMGYSGTITPDELAKQDEEYDRKQEIIDDEAARIKELKEELDEEENA